ncbi:hypothetical protein F5883DRAFT_718647 [Diaporthe sp. PMI_573]|nr:hypothetical protein F5883DRAFT_718647 [Diaporthaceae sp. PMI_573]
MDFKEGGLHGGFIFFMNMVALFSLANFGFQIYIIVGAFKWLEDFVYLSGHRSTNWNWTVYILVRAFIEILGTGTVFIYVYKSQGPEDRRKIMLSLFTISLLQLGITVPSWYAVRNCRWAELLRNMGHNDHTYHADELNSFGKAAIISWSVISFICLFVLIAYTLSVSV